MQDADSQYPKDWLERGRADLQAAELLLQHRGDVAVAAVLVQQSIEKYLKGFLLSRGWHLRKIHDLEVLLNEAVTHEEGLEAFRDLCTRASLFFMEQRYPRILASGLSKKDVADALSVAKDLAACIERVL